MISNEMEFETSIAGRVETAETNALFSRLSAIRDKEGNPEQVIIQRFGNATAFVIKGIPDPYFNSVRGLTEEEIDRLGDIIAFYREHNVDCRIDIAPDASPDLLRRLAELGYYQYGFHASLYGSLPIVFSRRHIDEEIKVRPFEHNEFGLYGEIYAKSFGMPEFLAPAVAQNNAILQHRPGWRFYLATYREEPAAIAALYVQDGVGSLAAAASLPAYRGKGCHSALLAARMHESLALQCDLVVGQARFGSISQSNMKRMGLQTAYTKAVWKPLAK